VRQVQFREYLKHTAFQIGHSSKHHLMLATEFEHHLIKHADSHDFLHLTITRWLIYSLRRLIETFQHAHHLNGRPFAATSSWNALFIQARCNALRLVFPAACSSLMIGC
jgi:hypothetical protein